MEINKPISRLSLLNKFQSHACNLSCTGRLCIYCKRGVIFKVLALSLNAIKIKLCHWKSSMNKTSYACTLNYILHIIYICLCVGLCDNGKSDISISAIIFYRFISINDIISIMLSAKNLVLSVSSSNLN